MTRTGPSSARLAPGRRQGRRTASTCSKYGSARAASSRSSSARALLLRVAISVGPAAASLRQHRVGVLVAEDRGDDRPLARLEAREQPVDGLGRVGAVADLVRRLGARAVPAARRSTSPSIAWPTNAPAASRAPPMTTRRSGTSPRHSSSRKHDGRVRAARRRASRAAIFSRVSPRTSVCSRPTFVSRTTRRVERRSSRRGGRRARPRRPRRRPRARRSRANAAAVSVSNCVAPTASAAARTRATARSNESASVSSRSCQPLTCGDVYAPTREAVGAEQRGDRARRRRLAVRADDVHGADTRAAGCRARRGARACARGRTPPATARATRPTPSRSRQLAVVVLVVRHEAGARVERARRRRSCSPPAASRACTRCSDAHRASACTIARAWPRRRASGTVTIDVIPSHEPVDDAAADRLAADRRERGVAGGEQVAAPRRGSRSRASRPRARARRRRTRSRRPRRRSSARARRRATRSRPRPGRRAPRSRARRARPRARRVAPPP